MMRLLCLLLLVACTRSEPRSRAHTGGEGVDSMEDARARRLASAAAFAPPASLASSYEEAANAVHALQRGEFAAAATLADEGLGSAPDNPYLHLVAGLADVAQGFIPWWTHYEAFEEYFDALEFLAEHPRLARALAESGAGSRLLAGSGRPSQINVRALVDGASRIHRGFSSADRHLARAEDAADIALYLCPAAWLVDWNDDGELDGDDALWEVHWDEQGNPIDRNDFEARMPMFRFDRGDIAWLRAMLRFQRAAVRFVHGYDLTNLPALLEGAPSVVLPVRDRDALREVQTLVLEALQHSERARRAYLAETDDELEWLANPQQRSYSFPDRLTRAGFDQWARSLRELASLFEGRANLPIEPMVQVLSERPWRPAPRRALDLRRLLREPQAITLRRDELFALAGREMAALYAVLARAFGNALVEDASTGVLAPWVAMVEGGTPRLLARRRIIHVN